MDCKRGYNWRLGDSAAEDVGAKKPMVVTLDSPDGFDECIMTRGNFSLDAGGLAILLLALAGVTLGLAGLLTWYGYWPILAFAMIQVALVAWLLIRTWERTWNAEWVSIGPECIEVVQQRHKRKRQWELEPAWAVVEVKPPPIAWYAPRVLLRSRGQVVELGRFLTVEEKTQLAGYLRRAIRKHSAMRGAINV